VQIVSSPTKRPVHAVHFRKAGTPARHNTKHPEGFYAVDEELEDASYTRQVGLRLRGVRRSKRLSLHDVEVASDKEFKASVLGAYERGERAISVPRLQRLASFYGVAVDQLLPPIDVPGLDADALDRRVPGRGITIDLIRLEAMSSQEANLLNRYVSMIKTQRSGFSGTALTIRREDLNALAVLLETDPESVKERMSGFGANLAS
jgi:transcriptional regulator with XRE-family HTH domain